MESLTKLHARRSPVVHDCEGWVRIDSALPAKGRERYTRALGECYIHPESGGEKAAIHMADISALPTYWQEAQGYYTPLHRWAVTRALLGARRANELYGKEWMRVGDLVHLFKPVVAAAERVIALTEEKAREEHTHLYMHGVGLPRLLWLTEPVTIPDFESDILPLVEFTEYQRTHHYGWLERELLCAYHDVLNWDSDALQVTHCRNHCGGPEMRYHLQEGKYPACALREARVHPWRLHGVMALAPRFMLDSFGRPKGHDLFSLWQHPKFQEAEQKALRVIAQPHGVEEGEAAESLPDAKAAAEPSPYVSAGEHARNFWKVLQVAYDARVAEEGYEFLVRDAGPYGFAGQCERVLLLFKKSAWPGYRRVADLMSVPLAPRTELWSALELHPAFLDGSRKAHMLLRADERGRGEYAMASCLLFNLDSLPLKLDRKTANNNV